MFDPLVTVLMTVYNAEAHLEAAVKSVLDQTYKDFEFLIINDASTDLTLDIIYSFRDDRIVVFNNEKNLGQTASLNVGLRHAKGKYIARMDADDISYHDRLEKQVEFMKKYPDCAVVGSDMDIIDINGNKKGVQKFPKTFSEIFLSIFYATPISHISALMKGDIILRIGGYDEDFKVVQDYDLWSRLIRAGYKLMNLKKTLVAGRVHENSVFAMEANKKVPIENSKIIKENVNSLTKINISEDEALNIFSFFHFPHLLTQVEMNNTKDLYKHILMNLEPGFPNKQISWIRNRNLSKIYYKMGVHQIENGYSKEARKSFIKSVYKNPFKIKPFILLFISFLRKNHIKRIREKLYALVHR